MTSLLHQQAARPIPRHHRPLA